MCAVSLSVTHNPSFLCLFSHYCSALLTLDWFWFLSPLLVFHMRSWFLPFLIPMVSIYPSPVGLVDAVSSDYFLWSRKIRGSLLSELCFMDYYLNSALCIIIWTLLCGLLPELCLVDDYLCGSCERWDWPWGWHWIRWSDITGWRDQRSPSWSERTIKNWSTSIQPRGWARARQAGHLFFGQFNFTLALRPGSKNLKPEALSRQSEAHKRELMTEAILSEKVKSFHSSLCAALHESKDYGVR